MRARHVLGLWLVVCACGPDAPTLDLTVSPRAVRRDLTATAHVFAQARPDVPGRGVVRLQSNVGSLFAGVEVDLDELGTATARLSCPDTEVGCSTDSMNVTATWLREPEVSARTSVRLFTVVDAGQPEADAGIPQWMDFPSGFFLDGSPTSIVPRRVFEPEGRIHITQYASDIGRLFVDLDPSPAGDLFDSVWSLHVAARQGEGIRVGTYTGARRFRSEAAPGIDLGGEGRRCNQSGGFFEVHEFTPGPDAGVLGLTLSFEHWCEGFAQAWVRGWVRLPPPAP